MRRGWTLLLWLALATPAGATPTTHYYWSADGATLGTTTSAMQFDGGLSDPAPTFEANTLNPGTGNRALLEFCAPEGGTSWGTVLFPNGATTDATVGTFAIPVEGARGMCVGGTRNGADCADDECPSGFCQVQRRPVIALKDATNTGCMVTQAEQCGNVNLLSGACADPLIVYQALYGSTQITGGRCGNTATMDDTPCGGTCDANADCLQGRPEPRLGEGATQCVRNTDDVTDCGGQATRCLGGTNDDAACTVASQCPGGSCADACHCINECDQLRPGEATCAAGTLAGTVTTPGTPQVLAVEQTNGANPGAVTCTLYGGRLSTTKKCIAGTNEGATCTVASQCPSGACEQYPIAYNLGGTTIQVGTCTGGSALAVGGRDGTACDANADCACNTSWPTFGCQGGSNDGAACSTGSQCPGGTCSGACTNGTCTTTARITPDRFTLGPDDANEQATCVQHDLIVQQAGSDPVYNWRGLVLAPDADGAVTSWTFTGGSDYQVFTNASEPDGNATRIGNTSGNPANWVHEVKFANVPTTSDTAMAASFTVMAQDTESSDSDSIGLTLGLRQNNGGIATTSDTYDLNLFEPNTGSSTSVAGNNYFPVFPFTLNFLPSFGTPLSNAGIDQLQGIITKVDAHSHAAAEGRITALRLEVAEAMTNPPVPDVLPGSNCVAVIGDSHSDDKRLYQALVARVPELGTGCLYDQATGGAAMGDIAPALPTLCEGDDTSGGLTTKAYVGAESQPVDVMFLEMTINTLHNAGQADPANPLASSGLGQGGYCEDWFGTCAGGANAGAVCWASSACPGSSCGSFGYGPRQSLACDCAETNNWYTALTGGRTSTFTSICTLKNATVFGTQGFCFCGANADCEMGKPAPAGTPMAGTCSGAFCVTTGTALEANATPATRSPSNIGCTGARGCSGVCLSGNGIARLLREVETIEDTAAACASSPTLVWVAGPPVNHPLWHDTSPSVAVWASELRTWAMAGDRNFVDQYSYMLARCGHDALLTSGADSPCFGGDQVHYSDFGFQVVGDLYGMCATNTLEDGTTGRTFDGECIEGQTCSGGTCTTGLRKGWDCSVDADCSYCGTEPRRGEWCDRDDYCGYWRCAFP